MRECICCCLFLVNIAAFAVGNGLTWTSPTLPRLQAPESWLHLHGDEVSWIGSLACLGAAIGPFPGGYLANKFGRKYTCYIAVIIEVLSWILLLLANSVYEIYVARVIAGIAAGLVYAVVPLYVGEIAEVNNYSKLIKNSYHYIENKIVQVFSNKEVSDT